MPDTPDTLPALAGRLRGALARADLARSDDQAAKAFTRLTVELRKRREQLDDARFLFEDDRLQLTVEEATSLETLVRTARDSGEHARGILASDPNALKSGPAWKAFDASATGVGEHAYDLLAVASARLVALHPRPSGQVASTLVAGDPKRIEFDQVLTEYDSCVRTRFATSAEVSAFVRSANRAASLAEDIERHAVPAEHRERWALLVAGALPLKELTASFSDWLAAEGHFERVVAGLRES